MRLTQMTDYALRLLMYLAQHPERLCTIAEIAEAHQVSQSHLTKITHQLGLAGWLETVRGKGGGMRLAMAPGEINLGGVVRSVEPDFALVECFSSGSRCLLTDRCGLAVVLNDALLRFLGHLDAFTLADIAARQRPKPIRVLRAVARATRPAPAQRRSPKPDA